MPLTTQPTLLSRMRGGDLAAWDQFALESTPFVLRWLQAEFYLSVQDAEDLWQDVFLRRKNEKVVQSYFKPHFRPAEFAKDRLPALNRRLNNPERAIDRRVAAELDANAEKLLAECGKATPQRSPESEGGCRSPSNPDEEPDVEQAPDPDRILKAALAAAFNRVVSGPSLYVPSGSSCLEGITISPRTRRLLERNNPVDVQRLNWLLLHDAYADEVLGIERRLLALVLSALRRTFHDFLDHRHAQKRDGRKTVSGDEPVSPEDPQGATRWKELEAEARQRYEERRKAVAERLQDALRDYPDHDEKRAYLDWFWSKADTDLTDRAIAEHIGMKYNRLRHIRDKVEQYLQRRRDNDPEFLDCPQTP